MKEIMRTLVNEIKPVVIYISGNPHDGKSTVSYLIENKQIYTFHTDEFFTKLKNSCPKSIQHLVNKHNLIDDIGIFLNKVLKENQVKELMTMLLDTFNPIDSISVIEGYLPNHMREVLLYDLRERGFYVWIMERSK
jgi:broad-specificity NMP kinase